MASSRSIGLLVTAWSVLPLLVACGVDTQNCAAPVGDFRPSYAYLGGNCGPIDNPDMVKLAVGNRGAPVFTYENRLNGMVTTEVVMKGCSMRVTQTLMEGGKMRSKINGESISIANSNEVKGQVTLDRWDDQGVPACSGIYNAIMVKNSTSCAAGACPGGTTAAGAN